MLSFFLRPLALAAAITFCAISTQAGSDGSWTVTDSISPARYAHTTTLLEDGKVLVAGGITDVHGFNQSIRSAEIYDPTAGLWGNAAPMKILRAGHTATLLRNGRVLVAGGLFFADSFPCELFDPKTSTWKYTGGLSTGRVGQAAVLLADGRVLIVGGNIDEYAVTTAEIYDPATGRWTTTANMNTPRRDAFAVPLHDGRVLVGGGYQDIYGPALTSSEIYDPATAAWTPTGDLLTGRISARAVTLSDGRVLAISGIAPAVKTFEQTLASAEIYDPATGTWQATGDLIVGRVSHQATLLRDGRVVVTGGATEGNPAVALTEIYDPATGTWSSDGNLNLGRLDHTSTLLRDGTVLVVGGTGGPATPGRASWVGKEARHREPDNTLPRCSGGRAGHPEPALDTSASKTYRAGC